MVWEKATLLDDCPLCQSWGTTDTEDDELKVNSFRFKMIDSEDWVKYLQDSLAEAALTELTRIAQENDMGY